MSCLRLLVDDAENVKPHLWLHGNMSLYIGWRGKNSLLSAIFRVEYLTPQIFKLRGALYRIDDGNMSNLILIITALCNNLGHLRLTR